MAGSISSGLTTRRRYVAAMEQRISLITLGVADVARARDFYQRLGWRGQEVEETVFFQAGGMGLVLWHRDKLADDAGLDPVHANGFRGLALAQNVRSRAEVDAVIAAAEQAGAGVTRRPAATFYGGYAGYFTDPDGHAWEIAYNPGFPLGEDGSITIPDFGRG
jgi:catechol 2,3-dioxygenase-like lactoylglutathione lyase family enzyme